MGRDPFLVNVSKPYGCLASDERSYAIEIQVPNNGSVKMLECRNSTGNSTSCSFTYKCFEM